MGKLIIKLEKNPWILYMLAIVLVFPALLINLGKHPFTSDEQIRGLVALEMLIRDNFMVPTMHGDFYLKKPPLFNWIILAYAWVFGNFDEFSLRLPTVVSSILYAATVFYFFRKHFGNKVAFANAIVLLTCGRMLFWDTQLALIDITFSWVIFINFMIIYEYFNKGKFWQLFLISYALTAIAFMLKGLPSVVFQGTTLLVFFIYKKRFLKLISWQHVAGILLFVFLLGIYYLMYFKSFPGTFEDVISTLFAETTRRTVLRFGWERTLLHLLTFPFEQMYHFLPWSVLTILLFRKKLFKKLFTHPLIKYNAVIMLANIIVYWTSPEVHPRYLLMFVPLFFSVLLYLYYKISLTRNLQKDIIDYVFIFLAIAGTLGSLVLPFLKQTEQIHLIWLKTLFVFLLLAFFTYLLIRMRTYRIILFGIILLIVRIGFNFSVLEVRSKVGYRVESREGAIKTGQLTKGKELKKYKNTWMDDFSAFYITRERMDILRPQRENFDTSTYYLVDERRIDEKDFEKIHQFDLVWERKNIWLTRIKPKKSKMLKDGSEEGK
ncbi:MAG: glycosyltransferase family 39 protein [Bacteroidales bacterium]|nr:glycosyltransferase family 39 protein [Bacteroidales bacterium]MCF8388114.1 glycosyltransferase family 39 protein [Bacteroidales bacterium]MCF8398773.1 glycosyltransferase family 39 protein [Bacteroidales bacterium]